MLDWTTYTEYKLEIKMVTSFGRDLIEGFSQQLGSSDSYFLFINLPMISSASFHQFADKVKESDEGIIPS